MTEQRKREMNAEPSVVIMTLNILIFSAYITCIFSVVNFVSYFFFDTHTLALLFQVSVSRSDSLFVEYRHALVLINWILRPRGE